MTLAKKREEAWKSKKIAERTPEPQRPRIVSAQKRTPVGAQPKNIKVHKAENIIKVLDEPLAQSFQFVSPSNANTSASIGRRFLKSDNPFFTSFNSNHLSSDEIHQIQQDMTLEKEIQCKANELMSNKKSIGYHLKSSTYEGNFEISNKLSERTLRPRILKKGLVKVKSNTRHSTAHMLSVMKKQINRIHTNSILKSSVFKITPKFFRTEVPLKASEHSHALNNTISTAPH